MLYLKLLFNPFDTELTEQFEQYNVTSLDTYSFLFELFFELHATFLLKLLLLLLLVFIFLLISSKESIKFRFLLILLLLYFNLT